MNKQTTAMQELIEFVDYALDGIKEHGTKDSVFNEGAKNNLEIIKIKATELLTKEREIRKADAIAFAEWIPHNAYIVEDEYYFCLLKNGIRVSLEELYELFTQTFKQD